MSSNHLISMPLKLVDLSYSTVYGHTIRVLHIPQVPLLQTALIALAQYDAAHRIAHVLKSAADVCRNNSTGILRKVADSTLAYTVYCDFG